MENKKIAAIVMHLKSKPPVNFNVSLHMLAAHHGVHVLSLNYHPTKPELHMKVNAPSYEHLKAVTEGLKRQFGHIVHEAHIETA